jgi:uroporphyrinogen-III synthase
MRSVLVLRPEPGASVTVEQARERGLHAVASPLFEVQPVAWKAPDAAGFNGLLLTSANALRYAGGQLQKFRALPAYVVGEATGEAARDAGFDVAASGDDGVDRLLGSIEPDLKLLHLCGQHHREAAAARQKVTAIPVYAAKAVDDPGLDAAEGAVALIYSPRSGRRFAELVANRASIAIAAISGAAADAVGAGWERIETAQEPTSNALLALAARLCNIPDPK